MEVSPLPIPGAEDGTEQIAAALHAQRRRVREFLSAQQDRLRRAERELSEQLQHIAAELADDRRQTRQTREELAHRSEELQRQAEAIERMKTDLAARQAEWEKLYRGVIEQQQSFADQLKRQQDEFDRRQQDFLQQQSAAAAAEIELMRERKEMEAGRAELESRRAELDALRDSLQSRQAELDALRDSLQTRQAELEQRQRELSARTAETESRRRHIAHELRAQRAANLKEFELKRLRLEQEIKADQGELQRQLESLQEECRILRAKPPAAENSVDRREVERIEVEKKELTARLAELEGQLAETRQELADARAGSGKDKEDGDDLRRRYEMSIDDLRELKARNEELQEQLASARRGGGGSASQLSPGVLNWEAEKQRILAALEADFEEDNEEDRGEKLKIQEVIRRTDRLVAEKNREIGELRQLLESQASNIGTMAVGAAALGQILDADAVIQEERKNLARLQEECRDKLCQAEIEISLERAKIARERAQLDEKLRALEQQGVNSATAGEKKEPAKPTRGRWLARLGLTGSEDEQENGT
jgi:chromosome segregation ATPase